MHRIVLPSVASLVLTIFFHIISQPRRFRKIYVYIEHKILFLFALQMLSETFLILRKMQRDPVVNVRG